MTPSNLDWKAREQLYKKRLEALTWAQDTKEVISSGLVCIWIPALILAYSLDEPRFRWYVLGASSLHLAILTAYVHLKLRQINRDCPWE